MANDPLWINASGGSPAYSAAELRQAMALPLMYGGRNMGARAGVRPGGNQLQVSLVGSAITVESGLMCVDPGLTTPQGPYWVAISPSEGHTLTAASLANPRKDIVIARVYDHDEDSSGNRFARTEYLVGTPALTPTEPTVPTGCFRMATIDVPVSGGGPAVVTNNMPFTVASGGLLPVRSAAERNALGNPYDGQTVWRQDRDWIEFNNGAQWRVATTPVVTSVGDLASIPNPFNGQLASNTGDGLLYRHNGSAWLPLPGVISEQVLGSTTPSVSFPSIPAGFRELHLSVTCRGTNASTFVELWMQFNGDTTNTYASQQLVGSAGSPAAAEFGMPGGEGRIRLGEFAAASAPAGHGGVHDIKIPGHAGAAIHKYALASNGFSFGTASTNLQTKHWTGQWRNTAAITSITLLPSAGSFAAGSRFVLEGR